MSASRRPRVAIWSPWPPAPSGIADYASEQLSGLAEHLELVLVAERPETVSAALRDGHRVATPEPRPDADLDLYHLGNSPHHAAILAAALERPGVLMLHEWSLHHLVLQTTLARGDARGYLQAMRRDHGAPGSFVARQVARGLVGDLLPALYPLNDTLLERSLGVVGLTRSVAERARRRLPERPVLHLPHHVSLPAAPLERGAARHRLGLPSDALIVTAPGLQTAAKRLGPLMRALAARRRRDRSLRLVLAGGSDERFDLAAAIHAGGLGDAVVVTGRLSLADFVHHVAAADVVAALRFPSHGEISGALLRSLGVGRPVLVTAGTPASEEFPEGVVVPVDPGPREAQELEALLDALLDDASLRSAISRVARAHVAAACDLAATTRALAEFLLDVAARREELRSAVAAPPAPPGTLAALLGDELRFAARDLGLLRLPPGAVRLVDELAEGR